MLKRIITLFLWFSFSLTLNNALAAPGDILSTLTINNVSGDGRTPSSLHGITIHDGYVWVLDFGTDRIYRVYPEDVYDEDGITLLFSAGDSDFNIPVADAEDPPINSDGFPIGACGVDGSGGNIYCGGGGLTFAENFIWNATPVADNIYKIDPVDGDNLETENALAGLAFPSPTDMTFDGTHFWIADWQTNTISKVLPEDGTVLAAIPGPSSLPAWTDVGGGQTTANIFGLTWDGQALWASDTEEDKIYRINPNDGALLNVFDSPGANPKGLAWDGESLWHVDQATATIYRLESGVIPFGIVGCVEKNGVAVTGDVLLSQNAIGDQATATDVDGCFAFASFTSGVPLQVKVSETGIDEKPVLTLVGADVTLIVGDTYSEPGVIATDTEDGDISADVIATPDVINTPVLIDTSISNPGGQTVTYNVIDSAGNAADPITRIVYVLEVDTTPPVITLNGDNPLYVEQGSTYTELGAVALDDRDGDISGSLAILGTVDAAVAGSYSVTYDVTDSTGNVAATVTRSVIVQDTTIPVITLAGSSPVTHERGDAYVDAGATASDNIDGDISASIIETGSVSQNTSGSYVITYDVNDIAGNAATTVTRTISVSDTNLPVLTLLGNATYNQELNTSFIDPGATASDYPSDDLSGDIAITGSVNTAVLGSYVLTYDVSDAAGNAAASISRTVVVGDTTPPEITLIGDNPIYHELNTAFTDPGATASDLIDGNITASIVTSGIVDSALAGTYTLTYNVNDLEGNPAATVTRDVIVADTMPPIITLSGAATVNHERGVVYTDAGASASDLIDGDLTTGIVVGGDAVDVNVPDTYIITYNVNDAVGNAAAPVTRAVNVADRIIPTITLVGANPLDHEVGTIFVDPGATASDNYDGNITASIGVTGTVDASTIGSYTLTYNVQDSSNNSAATRTRTVNVVDTGAPSIALVGASPILHELQTVFTDPGATASDAADGDLTGSIVTTGTVDAALAGTYTLSYNVSDSQANAATTVTRDVIVADRTAPMITLTGAATLNHEQGTTYTDAGATAADIIDGNISASISAGGSVDVNTAGTYILTYNVSDAVGNAATQVSRTVTVVDTTVPVITLIGANPLDHEVGTLFVDLGATANDNIDGVITGNIGVTGTVDASTQGSYILTFNVQDSSGNAATTVTRTVNVVDTGAPSIALIGANPILHELQTPFTDPGASASDAADGDLTGSIVTTGAVDTAIAGTYTLSYNVSDSQSNPATTVTRDVIVADRTAPIISLTGPAALNHEQGTTYTDAGATAADIIDGDITVNISIGGAVNSAVAGTYNITYNVSDAVGNAAMQVTRTVTVVDTTIPVITLAGANPLNHEVDTVFVDPGASASDNFDGVITGSIGVTGTVNANTLGSYTLTYNVQDSSGNNATTVTRTVNVVDTGAPSISLIGANPILHELQTAFSDPGATASDASDGNLTGSIISTGTVDTALAGTYTLSYNVTDSQSNAAPTLTRDVIVADRTAPTITLTGASTINIEQGTAYTESGATASDIIDGDLSGSILIGGAVNSSVPGTYTLTYNVSDAVGNAAPQVSRTVIVADQIAPVITLNGSDPINHEVNTIFTDPGATANDNIDGDISGSIGVSGTVNAGAVGSYLLTYNVNDSSGNSAATVTRTVNVADTGAPVINILGANPLNHELNTAYTDPGATASDAVDGTISPASITIVNNVNSSAAGSYTVTYDVNDSGGNPAAQQIRTVNVGDFTAPVITLTGSPNINIELGSSYTDAGATASDNIDGDLSASIITAGTVNSLAAGTYIISYDVSDAAGNSAAQLTRTVVVSDTTAPVITLLGNATINHEQGTAYSDSGSSATDNTDGDISGAITVSGFVDANAAGTYVLSYNVSDDAGNNAATVTRTVNVQDTIIPTLTLIGTSPFNHEQGTVYTDLGANANDSVDGDISVDVITTGLVDSNVAATYTLTYNVSDTAGNNAAAITRDVIVADTTPPAITLTGLATTNHEKGAVYNDSGATGFDSVDGDISASIVVNNTVNPNVSGSYTVFYDLTDAAGNTASTFTRTVVVADTIVPVIALTGPSILNHDQGAVYSDQGATASDNFDGDITSNIAVTGSVDENTPATYTITYNVNDADGNPAVTVTRDVVVADTTAPVITLTGNTTVNVEQGSSYTDAGATASDDVDGNLSGSIATSGDTVNAAIAGTYIIRYDITDAAGNAAAQVTRTVIVSDTTIPVIALVGTTPTNHQQGTAYTDSGFTASDNVDGNISPSVAVTGSVDENTAGTYVLSYNVTDAAGNAAITVTRTVVVADTQSPTIVMLGATPVSHEQGDAYNDAGATASDSLDGTLTASISTVNSVNTALAGSYTVTYDVSDAAGNAASQIVRTVNVADTTLPSITLVGDSSVDLTNGTIFVDPGYSATDNIDGDLSASILRTGTIDINTDGAYVLSYNVADAGGNAALTVTRTVNVITPTAITIEAETATIGGLHSVSTINTGYLGSGYVEHVGEGYIEYTFDAFGVPYNLEVRYAWDTGDRPLEVILNSGSLGNLSFPATGGLTTWLNTTTLAITPQSGTNTLRLSTTGLSGANIDQLIITPQ